MARRIYTITCMAVGVAALAAGAYLAFGIPAALIGVGVALIGVSVLLGWT